MKYFEQINNFKPISQEEKIEKEVFLKYINSFKDVLTRKNEICHLTSSAFIINKEKTKVLCVHHNIYNSWGWVGGHADGDDDMIYVAIKEAKEETGIQNIRLLSEDIISLDLLPVIKHYKKGKYITSHMHLSVAYLLEGDENDKINIQEEENSGVAWLGFNELLERCSEPHMLSTYNKIIKKIKNF